MIATDWYNTNFESINEKDVNADIRKHIILHNLPHWGGKMTYYGGNSYTPELEALAHTLAILPSTWNLNIYTDSNSAIEALENLHSAPIAKFQHPLLRLVDQRKKRRIGETNLI